MIENLRFLKVYKYRKIFIEPQMFYGFPNGVKVYTFL